MGARIGIGVLLLIALSACKLEISVPANGYVESNSQSYGCYQGRRCVINVTDTHFSETFVAFPAEDYQFTGWKKGEKYLCGGLTEPCELKTKAFAGNDDLMSVLNSDVSFYLEPVFEPIAHEGTVISGDVYDYDWDLSGSPYLIDGLVVVHTPLTIHPGVEIMVKPGPYKASGITTLGGLSIAGTENEPVTASSRISAREGPLNVRYLVKTGSALDINTSSDVLIEHSYFDDEPLQVSRQYSDASPAIIRKNLFYCAKVKLFVAENVAFTNNYLWRDQGCWTRREEYGDIKVTVGNPLIQRNTFGRNVHFWVDPGANLSPPVNASNNYWGTISESAIRTRIEGDKNTRYSPWLTVPDLETPTP